YLFGSVATGKANLNSDIDVCIIGNLTESEKNSAWRKFDEKYDVSFFEELPIQTKIKAFKEGRVLFMRNKGLVVKLIFKTVHEYEDFKPIIANRVKRNLEIIENLNKLKSKL
ncbi:MAG: nucleotidyltransferase domain-containing protein, partial [Candidatus Absconditabacterales bacterium]|nr:nucleotidyltransferase domain-containing protein [Candidatus Absconditabacterales bacterium]